MFKPYIYLYFDKTNQPFINCGIYTKQLTFALTAAADNAAAAATVTSLSVFLAAPASSDDADLSPADWVAYVCNVIVYIYAKINGKGCSNVSNMHTTFFAKLTLNDGLAWQQWTSRKRSCDVPRLDVEYC